MGTVYSFFEGEYISADYVIAFCLYLMNKTA